MSIVQHLKLLARGVHPETGEVLPPSSSVNRSATIRVLFELADELNDDERRASRRAPLSPEERRAKNVAEGRPARSHFPWLEAEKTKLVQMFREQPDIQKLAPAFERSTMAVATQLAHLGLIADEEIEKYR